MTTSTLTNSDLTLGGNRLTESLLGFLIDICNNDVLELILDVSNNLATIELTPGLDGAPGADGLDGAPGADGQDGAPGADGQDGTFLPGSTVNTNHITNDGGGLVINTKSHSESTDGADPARNCNLFLKDRSYPNPRTNTNAYMYAYFFWDSEQIQYRFRMNGKIVTENGVSTASDDRLKHNETTIDNVLDIVMKLKVKRYLKSNQMYDASHTLIKDNSGNYINLKQHDSVDEEIGFIAQELLDIEELSFVVDCDQSGNETSPYSVNYNNIFVVGIQAIQELKISLDAEKEKVKALESKIVSQETLINSLLERVTALENK